MNKMKSYLFSERGMNVVNVLFMLSLFGRNVWFTFIAYIIWALYLIQCIKTTSSKVVKSVYIIFIAYAIYVIVSRIIFLLGGFYF